MNRKKIIEQLKEKYPGKRIIESENEIICEISPSSEHKDYSVCISVFDVISPHYHKEISETYRVLEGSMKLKVDEHEFELHEGDFLQIPNGSVHAAIGDETWIECRSEPGWRSGDHFELMEDGEAETRN